MDATDGLAEPRSELDPDSGQEVRAVAAPGPFFGAPGAIDVADALLRGGAESAPGLLDHERPSFGRRDVPLSAGLVDRLRAHLADAPDMPDALAFATAGGKALDRTICAAGW